MIAVGLIALLGTATAEPKKARSRNVTIMVIDAEGKPLSEAVVRHEKASFDSFVNSVTGMWKGREIFDSMDNAHPFRPGDVEKFTVKAPGYDSQELELKVRCLRNKHVVVLQEEASSVDNPTALHSDWSGTHLW